VTPKRNGNRRAPPVACRNAACPVTTEPRWQTMMRVAVAVQLPITWPRCAKFSVGGRRRSGADGVALAALRTSVHLSLEAMDGNSGAVSTLWLLHHDQDFHGGPFQFAAWATNGWLVRPLSPPPSRPWSLLGPHMCYHPWNTYHLKDPYISHLPFAVLATFPMIVNHYASSVSRLSK